MLTPLTEEQRARAEAGMGVAKGYVLGRRYPRQEREDLLQVARLAVVMAARKYRTDAPYDFGTYAWMRVKRTVADYVAANRLVRIPIDGHRRKSRRPSIQHAKQRMAAASIVSMSELRSDEDLAEFGRNREQAPDAACEAAEFADAMWMAISRLPAFERDVIEAVCVGGREMADLAREQGRWPSVIRTVRERGLSRLRKRLREFDPMRDSPEVQGRRAGGPTGSSKRSEEMLRWQLDVHLAAAASPHLTQRRRHRAARSAASMAEKLGILVRPSACEGCADSTAFLQRHHPDHEQPLAVVYLCRTCHTAADDAQQRERIKAASK